MESAFEFAELQNPAFPCEYKPNEKTPDGKGLQLELNLDVITLDYLEYTGRFIQSIQNAAKAVSPAKAALTDGAAPADGATTDDNAEVEKAVEETDFYNIAASQMRNQARILGGKPGDDNESDRVIRKWNLVKKGVPVPVSYETMISLGFKVLADLFNYCVYRAGQPTKKNEAQSDSIS